MPRYASMRAWGAYLRSPRGQEKSSSVQRVRTSGYRRASAESLRRWPGRGIACEDGQEATTGRLVSQAELFDQRTIALRAGPVEVAQHAAALADHLEQPPAGVIIVLVLFEMLGQIADALGQNSNLHL